MREVVLKWIGIAVLLGLAASDTGCTPGENSEGPVVLETTVDTSLVVGVNAEEGPAYALGDPVGVEVDSAGRLYVADNSIPAIQVYDDAGTHLRTIGGKGPGPGEFQEIQDLHVHGDTLTVICPTEVERFRLGGQSLDTFTLDDQASWRALHSPNDRWILGAYSARGGPDSLLRVYSDNFNPTRAAFGRASEFVDSNIVSKVTIGQHVGSLGTTSDGGVLLAPYLYEGQIAEYRPKRGRWRRIGTWMGYTERDAYEYEKVTSDAPAKEAKIYTTYAGVFNAIYYNKSLGLFRRDDRVFHFTSTTRRSHRRFGAEIYQSNGTMQGYAPLTEIATNEDGVPVEVTPTPEAIGPDGAFYLIEKGYDAVPKVVVLSLSVEKID